MAAAASASSEVRVASRRIVDYLNDGEELGLEGAGEAPPCSPAAAKAKAPSVRHRFRWPRLGSLGRKGAARKGKEPVEEEPEEVVVVAEKRDRAPVAAVSTSAPETATESDAKHSDHGVGLLSLVFLMAKTSDEFSKMVKVRAEMESLLKEIRGEVRIKAGGGTEGHDDGASRDRNRESTTSSCVTDGGNDQGASARLEFRQADSSGPEPASYDKSSFEDGGCGARMDVLEEEFHAEMERLQVEYGSETPSSFLPGEEEEERFSEPYDEMADYRGGVDDDSGEVVEDEDDDDSAEFNGVSALELERRLHELLHERNRDRIEELEDALRRAEKQLVEKEMEVSLWKETAKFALRQDNELQ